MVIISGEYIIDKHQKGYFSFKILEADKERGFMAGEWAGRVNHFMRNGIKERELVNSLEIFAAKDDACPGNCHLVKFDSVQGNCIRKIQRTQSLIDAPNSDSEILITQDLDH